MLEQIKTDLEMLYKTHPRRLKHIYGVREQALHLGEKFGADLDKLELASLLHDITKYYTNEENHEIIKRNFENHESILKEYNEHILHSFTAKVVARKKYYIKDEDILGAIESHTVGKPDMNIYEKIIFISDYTEKNRTYDSCVKTRKLVEEDIDFAVFTAINDSIRFYENLNDLIPDVAYRAREFYRKNTEVQNG